MTDQHQYDIHHLLRKKERRGTNQNEEDEDEEKDETRTTKSPVEDFWFYNQDQIQLYLSQSKTNNLWGG